MKESMHSMIVGLYHRVELYSCFEVSQLCLSIRSCFYFVLSNESLLRTKMFGVFFWHSQKQLCYQYHIFVCFDCFFNITLRSFFVSLPPGFCDLSFFKRAKFLIIYISENVD